MSDKNNPPPYPGGVADMMPADQNRSDDSEMRQVWKFIYIDMSYVKRIPGILQAAELILSLMCIISVSVPKNEGCAFLYSGSYSYMKFVCSSCFITCIIWYGLYLFAITKKVGFILWDISHVIWCAFYILNYLIASSVLAAHVCRQDGYKAATAFGFFCLIVIIVDGGLTFSDVYNRYTTGTSSRAGQTEPKSETEAQHY